MPNRRILLDSTPFDAANFGEVNINFDLSTEHGGYFFRNVISDALVFVNEAYGYILQQIAISQCQRIAIEIQQYCEGAWVTIVGGFFTRHSCRINYDKCKVEADIEVEDEYTCLLKNANTKINILAADGLTYPPTDLQYIPVYGLEVMAVAGTTCGALPNWGAGYTPLTTYTSSQGNPYCIYARYVVRVNCLGGALQPPAPAATVWTLLSNDCAIDGTATYWRNVQPTEVLLNFSDNYCAGSCVPTECGLGCIDAGLFLIPLPLGYERICACPVYTTYTIPNGRELPLIMEFMLGEICPTLTFESELLTNDTNPVTGENPNPLKPSYIFKKSDVALPTASEWATVGELAMTDLLDNLSKIVNGAWYINGTVLTFEHITGILSATVGLDLTTYQGGKWAKARNAISYNKPTIPKQETFEFAAPSVQIDFVGKPIIYSQDCATTTKVETRTDWIDTELVRIFNNSNEAGDNSTFVLISGGSINQDDLVPQNGELTGLFVPNAPYSWANLHRDYFKYYRYLQDGELNGVATTFFTTRPIKRQENIVFPMCCFNDFDPLKLVKTEIGEGRVVSGQYNLASQMMTLTLIFEDNE